MVAWKQMARGIPWLFLLLPLALPADSGSPVEGQLLNSMTHGGILGVMVTISNIRQQLTYQDHTDAQGRFYFPLVAPGEYAISFDAREYLPLAPWDPATRVFHVADGNEAVKFQVELTPYGVVAGRIVDGEGRPAAGAEVEMLRARGGGMSLTTTDGAGGFSIRGLGPGAYVLLARPLLPGSGGSEHRKSTVQPPTAPEGEHVTWATTYYPDSTERAGAQTVLIRPGSNLAGYHIHLRESPTWRVRGVVVDEQRKPVAAADITLQSADPLAGAEAHTQSAADGSFELPAVCPGEWRLVADVQRGTVLWKAAAPLSVSNRDLENVTLQAVPPFSLNVIVERDDPRYGKGERQPVSVMLSPVDGARDRQPASTSEQGDNLRIEGVYPGRYRIVPMGFIYGYYVASVRLGLVDVTGQPVDLSPSSPPIVVTYKSGVSRVVGLVDNGPASTVALVPRNETLLSSQFVRIATAGLDGIFDLTGLRPGDYYIFAFDRVDPTALYDADFVRNLLSRAERVHMEPGEAVLSPKLKVTPWPE